MKTEANLQLPAPFEDEDALIDKFATVDLKRQKLKSNPSFTETFTWKN
jgi:hypothetical protein